jgi:hypothetical protein
VVEGVLLQETGGAERGLVKLVAFPAHG